MDQRLNTTKSIDEIFRQAQRAFNAWSELKPEQRTTDALLRTLDFDFFEVLDSVTIARSRKHIERYYDTSEIENSGKAKAHQPASQSHGFESGNRLQPNL